MAEQHAELLDDVARKVADMVRLSPPGDTPEDFGRRVADMLAEDWGGITVYVPKNLYQRFRKRNAEMYAAYTGRNVSELARLYGISEQRVYAIMKEERERRRIRQAVLPGFAFS